MIIAIVTIVYLVLLFGISSWAQKNQEKIAAKGSKTAFLMAGKNLPLLLVVMFVAGGSIGAATTTGVAQHVQVAGVSAIWYSIANIIGLLFLGIVGASRIRKLGYSTNNEMIADYSGRWSRFLMVVGQLIIMIGVGCLQFVSGGAMLSAMFPGVISYEFGILITAIVFTVICMAGGLYGTSLANVINVIMIYLGLTLCTIFAVRNIGGMSVLLDKVSQVSEPTLNGGGWLSLTGGLGVATIFSYMVSEPGNRITTQANTAAAAAASSSNTARKGIIIGALLLLPITVLSVIMGLVAKVQFPDILSSQALSAVILSVNPAIAAFGMAGLWAVTVSTGIVLLMASVQVTIYDIMVPINMSISNKAKNQEDPNTTAKTMKIQSQIITLVIAGLMLFLAYKATSFVVTIITVLCITPAFFWIMVCFLYFPRLIKKRSVLVTLIVAYIFFFLWLFVPQIKTAFPTPIYVEWPLCTATWFLISIFDKEAIDTVVPKSERKNLKAAGVLAD